MFVPVVSSSIQEIVLPRSTKNTGQELGKQGEKKKKKEKKMRHSDTFCDTRFFVNFFFFRNFPNTSMSFFPPVFSAFKKIK